MAAPLAAASTLPELSPDAAIHEFLHALNRPQRLLVAVSGGSDSLGLLLGLKSALETSSFPHRHSLVAATVDHGLRPAAAEEARQVAALCADLGVPHLVMRWAGEKPQTGLSAAARHARYTLLAEAAKSLGATAIVTGHTLDDQIETVAMRGTRSSEEALGLSGMAKATLYAGHIWILRPFLHTRRQGIRDSMTDMGHSWIDDPSNEDPHYERVRTRRALPFVDPAWIDGSAGRRQTVSSQAADWLTAHAAASPGPVIVISCAGADGTTQEIRDHGLATLIAILGGKQHRPSSDSLARLTKALALGADFRLTLSGTLVLRRRNELFFVRERRGFLPLFLEPGGHGIWDGRYAFVNEGSTGVTITAGPAAAHSPQLPGPIRNALAGNFPQVVDMHNIPVRDDGRVRRASRLSLYGHFLPLFDQSLANAIAPLIGAEPSPPSPI